MTTVNWQPVKDYSEIIFERAGKIAKITMNRPEKMNAFTPVTIQEMIDAFTICRDDSTIGVIILTGAGDKAFSSGGDQGVRGNGGYVGPDKIARLNVLDLQHLIRIIPKPVIAMVKGWSVGGGNILQLVCDLTIAADNAKFGQTGPKRAKEVWFLNHFYSAEEAYQMNWINKVVPLDQVESVTLDWCNEILKKSPTALRFIKAAMNADTDGLAGLQQLGGDATMLFYTTDEGKEGRDAFNEKRDPNFDQFPKFP